MAANRYDALIIGGGHNGLVCGSYLAKAGLKVLVLERRHIFGGAAVTEEIAPGFRASIFSYVMSILHPRIIADLELRRFGLEVLPANDLFTPLYNDDQLVFSADMKTTQENFARFSKKDAEAYPASELKHGPLALIEPALPTVAIVPDDDLLEKNRAALEEIKARSGKILAVAHQEQEKADQTILVPKNEDELDPILMGIPLQLLAYHTALALGRDIDKPRNLAKSVTVE